MDTGAGSGAEHSSHQISPGLSGPPNALTPDQRAPRNLLTSCSSSGLKGGPRGSCIPHPSTAPGPLLATAHSYRMSAPPRGPAAPFLALGLAAGPLTQFILVPGDDHDV